MTDLLLPDPNQPKECLEWALRTLDLFSRKERRGVLAVKQIQGIARHLVNVALLKDPSLHNHPMLRKHGQVHHHRKTDVPAHQVKLLPKP